MSATQNLSVNTECVEWRSIKLPHPNKYLKSSVFSFDGFKWYFEVACYWQEKNYNTKHFEEVWMFNIRSSNHSNSSTPYIIMPHIKVENKYVRLASTINANIWRSSISSVIGSDVDVITVLFFFSRQSLTLEVPVYKITLATQTRGKNYCLNYFFFSFLLKIHSLS